MAIVNMSINAMKFEEITVTFQPRIPSKPIIITTENKQLLIGTIIQINFLKTNHKVAIINNKTPKPKTTISLLMKVIIQPKSIIGLIPLKIKDKKANTVVRTVYKIGQNILFVVRDIISKLFLAG